MGVDVEKLGIGVGDKFKCNKIIIASRRLRNSTERTNGSFQVPPHTTLSFFLV